MLNLEQKLYQLIINRLDGDKLSSASYREQAIALVNKGIGGFILFGGKKDETKNFIDKLQSLSKMPLFIASDIERGVGQQVAEATRFPSQMSVAAAINKNKADDVELLKNAINAIAREALDIGINMPLIPVLDVNRNPDNPIICTRAFSDDPEEVAWYGITYITVLEKAGVLSCAKHFPGHGDTSIDSHIELPVISKSLKELVDIDILPFVEAVTAGVSSIMVGHLSIPAFDILPATLSEKIITGLLRNNLGYKGIIMTDALNMSALKEYEHVPVQCINAGFDILLHPENVNSVIEELKQAVSYGKIKEETINSAVTRILKSKSKIKRPEKPEGYNVKESGKSPLFDGISYIKHAVLSDMISERAVTLVKNTPGVLPIRDIRDFHLVFAGDENSYNQGPLRGFIPDYSSVSVGAGFKPALEEQQYRAAQTIIVAIFTNVAAWKGSSGISEGEIRYLKELMNKSRHSIVISFGSPYVLRHFNEAEILIAAYDPTEQAQSSVIKCLNGELSFRGRLPVNFELR
jgi:beta-glucosidase-like glycosyl hydrolase